ncbi:HNH endonuclease [Pseudomonas sp.]|uniref:HNH endonuclease n=1 Tax=Pseudomonas sp. TaxID=306 RepID=UPI002C4D1C8F|nr:HNH endonuclease [Pseudomonas sp.]HUE93586.1 HNH endonuclease [Pseudomonas sp.]
MARLTTLKPRVKESKGRQLAQVNPDSWRQGKTTAERGYGSRWQRARETFLAHNPLCVYCQKKGRVEVATVVDHIVDHRGNQDLFWQQSNWQPLCKPCHDSVKRLEVRRHSSKLNTMEPATMIHIVIGPTCAGKSTFVQLSKADGDVVVDYDQLAQALGAGRSHKATGLVKDAAFAAREAVIDMLLASRGGSAWIIHTRPAQRHIEKYQLAHATFHVVNPGMDECIRRTAQDDRPEGSVSDIQDWFKNPVELDERGFDRDARARAINCLLSEPE